MHPRSALTAAAVLMSALSCFAQAPAQANDTCPRTQAETVAASVTFHGRQSCRGMQITINEITISSPGDVCPVVVVITPEHQVEKQSRLQTMVAVHGQAPVEVQRYRCERTWLGPILLSSVCKFADRRVGAGTLLMTTVPCRP